MKYRMKPAPRRGGLGHPIGGSMASTMTLLSSLFITTTFLSSPTSAALTQEEILQKLYTDLNGDNWEFDSDSDSYWTGSDVCSYTGVKCNSDSKITAIELSDSNLVGSISPHIYTLPYLKKIDFSKNRITNAGWDGIDDILEDDDLVGEIEIIDVTNNLINTVAGVDMLKESLTGLHMTYNNLKGSMPSELFELKQLELLAVSENELTGEIPTELGTLTNLLEFYCYGNKMTGVIPTEIGKLTRMQIITFAENELSGELPKEIRNMGNLQTFSVHNNDPGTGAHTGPLPKFDTHPYLTELYLDGNAFTGSIPHNFLKLVTINSTLPITLGLANNQLTGTIPVDFLKFDSIDVNLVGNNFSAFDNRICDDDYTNEDIGDWMNGLVEIYGCDAILCPVGTYSDAGRQEDEESVCVECDVGTGGVMGATECASDVPSSDELPILAEFYLATAGTEWTNFAGWNVFKDMESAADLTLASYQQMNIDPCTFEGVECDDNKKVQVIKLANNNLEGLVPSSFWDLQYLSEIDLSGNELRLDRDFGFGDIGNAPALEKVDLSSNDIQSFNGISKATKLKDLIVDDAYFFSSLKDTEVLKMDWLEMLHMQFSGLRDTLTGISALKNLKALNLLGNELTGSIPDEIGTMTKLWHIDLSGNNIGGPLPTEALKNLIMLQKFHVSQPGRSKDGAGITGKLPSFKEQTKLHMLDVNSNLMTGSIPEDFLSGVTDVDQEMQIDIGYNEFTGTIPAGLKKFTNMRFDAVKNKLTGVNSDLCNQRGWFNGEVGDVMDQDISGCDAILCPVETYNDYGRARSSNNGGCKSCPGGKYAGATSCDTDGDGKDDNNGDDLVQLEKDILDKLFTDTGGSGWTKGTDTWTDGPVCSYEGITCLTDDKSVNEGVAAIELPGFGLTANIPTEIYQLPFLAKVDFSNNNVDMSFKGIENADSLAIVLMNDADLTSLEGIGRAPALQTLHISRNSFPEGDIPEELYDVTTLQKLALSWNGFEGSISPKVKNLVDIKEFWAGNNDITGSIPSEFSQLDHLTSLVLSGNRMSGEIPNSLEDITDLKQLHLNGQRDFGGFTGPLPSFSESPHIHDIDFSHNSLTGSIPDDFMKSVRQSMSHDDYAYDKLDFSSNQLTGEIPDNWDDFVGIYMNFANNRITGVSPLLCDDDDEFMNGLVGNLTENKCDAILCPPGTFTSVGRQTSPTDKCQACPGGEGAAPFYGTTKCKSVSPEREILQELHGLIFTGASEDSYWMSDHPICSWYGITCDDPTADEGVTEIKLESNSLETDAPAKVSSLFFSLPDLEKLNIRGNEGLPLVLDDVGKPQRLSLLQLSATGLKTIEGVGKAVNLKELHFTENDIEGTFPEEIFELGSMERLYTSFNKLSGPLPTRIGELTDLIEFYAYTNEMTGPLPTELGNLAKIENLVLGQNSFTGSLPTELNKLENLKEFSVYYNKKMTGPVLPFSSALRLRKLDLEGNQFTGQIPSTFLSGLMDGFKSNQENEIILHLADNALTGTLPEDLSSIKNLYLDIVGNQFTKVPPSFCQQTLWMNGAVGSSDEPCHAIACPPNTYSETGRLPDEGGSCTSCGSEEATEFIGSYNCHHVDVEMTSLMAFYRSTNGESWTENEHWMDMDTPMCSWYGIECAGDSLENNTITAINLPGNNLGGTMPHQVYDLPYLQTLNLKENSLFMRFDNIGRSKNLEVLYISDIDIGSIEHIGRATALKELHLTANGIKGKLPDSFFDLADTLERLYIAYNSFSGTLSTQFGKMTKLIDFYAYDNEFTGSIPVEFAKLPNLENFVVAENQLSGTIAEEFGYMPQLKLFSAYRRLKPGPKLSGPLPSFSNAPNLEGLYLDYNHLSGAIPTDFLQSSLHTKLITISHNFLTGKVPTQLQAFEALNIEMEGNKITEFDDRFCENLDWMDGKVMDYGCDAFMCRPGYYSIYGRQNTTDSACKKCEVSADADPTPYWGSTSCDGVVDEKGILELLYSKTSGDYWYKNDNWMKSDDICTWYGVECKDGTQVRAIRLGANNLVGTPPEEIFGLRQLHTLWLHSNPIDFKFAGIDRAQNLIELRLDSTGLANVYGIGKASSLIKLDLKFNQISGPFPQELLNLGKLKSLALTDNSLTGAVPNSFGKLGNLIELRLGSNLFSGPLKSFSDLENLIQLDLSDNDLVGTIPADFLKSLSAHKPIEVDLSSNSLSGGVPLELDRLTQLVIYLRDNRFTSLSPMLCDSNNRGWNLRDVEMFGCNAIMCPPKTANYRGRQSGETNPCMKCESNLDLYGQVTCDGMPLEASSSSYLVQAVLVTLISTICAGVLLDLF